MLVSVPTGGQIRVLIDGPSANAARLAEPTVLLLHGFMGGADSWPAEVVRGLSESRRVLRVDLPGHGASDTSHVTARYSIQPVLRDLAAVLDEVGVASADWVGYSMGGRVAMAAAVLSPGRVRNLVLESASPGLATDVERANRRASDEALATRLETESFERFVDDWMALPLFASKAQLGDRWLADERARRLGNDPLALAACLRGMGTGSMPSFWSRLEAVGAPTCLLTGAEDTKFVGLARQMARTLPGADLCSVPGAGHTVHAERPTDWLKSVTRFLDAQSGSSDST